jgi:rhodanese-related sulfurtransferase
MNSRRFLIIAAVFLCGITRADDTKSDGATHVDAKAAEKLVKEGKVTVVDVRTVNEYKQGHIAGAKNIDFTENDFESQVAKLDKSKPYLVHCASGHRSTNSLETFKKLGFKSIYHLDGGLKAWEAAGKPVTKN